MADAASPAVWSRLRPAGGAGGNGSRGRPCSGGAAPDSASVGRRRKPIALDSAAPADEDDDAAGRTDDDSAGTDGKTRSGLEDELIALMGRRILGMK